MQWRKWMEKLKGISETQLLMTITTIMIIIFVLYANIGFQLFDLIKGFASIIHQNITRLDQPIGPTHFVAYAQRHHMTAVTRSLALRTVCRRCRQVYRRTRHTVEKKGERRKETREHANVHKYFSVIFSFHILFINSSDNGNGMPGRRLCMWMWCLFVFVCIKGRGRISFPHIVKMPLPKQLYSFDSNELVTQSKQYLNSLEMFWDDCIIYYVACFCVTIGILDGAE